MVSLPTSSIVRLQPGHGGGCVSLRWGCQSRICSAADICGSSRLDTFHSRFVPSARHKLQAHPLLYRAPKRIKSDFIASPTGGAHLQWSLKGWDNDHPKCRLRPKHSAVLDRRDGHAAQIREAHPLAVAADEAKVLSAASYSQHSVRDSRCGSSQGRQPRLGLYVARPEKAARPQS